MVPTKSLALPLARRKSASCFCAPRIRRKDGKEHRAWSVVENRRVHDGRVVQRQVLYLGEINDSQKAAWSKAIEVIDEGTGQSKQIALFPEDRLAPALDCDVVSIRLSEIRLRRPRQWGACWMATLLWDQLRLDEFWLAALPPSREGTNWLNILKTLVGYRLISPGSEWRLHRHWFEHSAMGDLLGEDIALVQPNNLYRCLDKLTAHEQAMFTFLGERWKDLFQADFDVLLYDLTSTYFECDPPGDGKRKFGYSRDKRSDCVQVVIALIVTPDGFPLAYEVRRLRELQRQDLTRDELLLKLGAAKKEAGKAYTLLVIHTPTKDQPVTSETFHFALNRKKLRQARRREGSYLLRSILKSDDPGHLWRLYLQLVEVEQAFKELKNDLSTPRKRNRSESMSMTSMDFSFWSIPVVRLRISE